MVSQSSIKDPKQNDISDLGNKTVKIQQSKKIVTEEVKIQDVNLAATVGKKVAKAGSIIEPNISSREKLDKIDKKLVTKKTTEKFKEKEIAEHDSVDNISPPQVKDSKISPKKVQ